MLGAGQSQASRKEATDCPGHFSSFPSSYTLTWSSLTIASLQVVGLVASHVQASIRGSLLVSLLLQLVDDRDSGVAQTAVRSLALLVHLLDDSDKLSQVTRELWQHVLHIHSSPILSGACQSDSTYGQGGDSGN